MPLEVELLKNMLDIQKLQLQKKEMIIEEESESDEDDDNKKKEVTYYLSVQVEAEKATFERVAKAKFDYDKIEDEAYLARIDTEEKFQGKGYGMVLMYAVLLKIQEEGFKTIALSASPSNCIFYLKNGFYYPESEVNEKEWHQLSLEDKKNIIYIKNNSGEKTKEEYFKDDGEDEENNECFLNLCFNFEGEGVELLNTALSKKHDDLFSILPKENTIEVKAVSDNSITQAPSSIILFQAGKKPREEISSPQVAESNKRQKK